MWGPGFSPIRLLSLRPWSAAVANVLPPSQVHMYKVGRMDRVRFIPKNQGGIHASYFGLAACRLGFVVVIGRVRYALGRITIRPKKCR